MKHNTQFFVLFVAILILISGNSLAQKTIALDIGTYDGYGMIQLKEGEVIKDTLYFSFAGKGLVKIAQKREHEIPKKYSPREVEYFTIGDTTFVPVKTAQAITGEFMIRLTPENYKIQLYKKYEQDEATSKILYKYFALFPDQKNAKDIVGDITLMPFAKKVPKYIADCSDLAEKISKKEEPYKIPFVSNEQTCITVYMKVAEAYQECK